jgi:hypothetical protein
MIFVVVMIGITFGENSSLILDKEMAKLGSHLGIAHSEKLSAFYDSPPSLFSCQFMCSLTEIIGLLLIMEIKSSLRLLEFQNEGFALQ